MAKLVLGIIAGLLVALPCRVDLGQVGSIGHSPCAPGRRAARRPARARAAVLDARVAIYSVNFGEASEHLENARDLLRRAAEQLKSLGRSDEVKHVQTAPASIDNAQRLAGKLDQNANTRAGEAARVLANVLDVVGNFRL